ncbi:hypothetical protein Tco_1125487 [Tanacetum coccineum]|uniref:Reverse transcriptase domain-containing protein n=1 Tax=Tanacetum coccineum TaxID=301880 RepID=A0ABQ5J939_9ASTR
MATTPTIGWTTISRMYPRDNKVGAPATSLPLMIETPRRENLDRYCDYHGEKRHYTNDCYQLKRQLEAALESGKLNHLVKDVRQRGGNRGKQTRNGSANRKIINMVYEKSDSWKRKFQKKRRTADNRGRGRRLSGSESVCGSRCSSVGDVRPLLPQPMSDHSSSFNANSHGIIGVLWRTITANRKNRIGSYVRKRRLESKNYDEVHDSTWVIPIQHYLGTNMDERAPGHLIHHSCNDEISHPKGNCHTSSLERCYLRMQATRRQADSSRTT